MTPYGRMCIRAWPGRQPLVHPYPILPPSCHAPSLSPPIVVSCPFLYCIVCHEYTTTYAMYLFLSMCHFPSSFLQSLSSISHHRLVTPLLSPLVTMSPLILECRSTISLLAIFSLPCRYYVRCTAQLRVVHMDVDFGLGEFILLSQTPLVHAHHSVLLL